MKLRTLSETDQPNNLLEDPNWAINIHGLRFNIPINYQQAKARIAEEMHYLNFNDVRDIFEGIQKSRLHASIDIMDYPQYFAKPQGEFHVDDEFSHSTDTRRMIKVNDVCLLVTTSRYGYGENEGRITGEGVFPPEIEATLKKWYADNKMILLQALHSYMRDNGRSIREFGLRIPYYGM